MSYRVQFEPVALKFLRKLRDEKLRQRIIQDIVIEIGHRREIYR